MTIGLSYSTRFWDTVEDCLVEIYSLPAQDRSARVELLFRSTLRLEGGLQSGARWLGELVYHSEPINLAGELAQQPVPNTPSIKEEDKSGSDHVGEKLAGTGKSAAERLSRLRFQKSLADPEAGKKLRVLKLDGARTKTMARERGTAGEKAPDPVVRNAAAAESNRTARKQRSQA